LSFNKFSSEFPDLRADDQTKEELKIRVQKLSNDLWEIIDARKNESLAKIAEMTSGGWSDHEMRNLVRNMASLMEIEISKFVCVHHISIF
jgi:predicted acyl esterase